MYMYIVSTSIEIEDKINILWSKNEYAIILTLHLQQIYAINIIHAVSLVIDYHHHLHKSNDLGCLRMADWIANDIYGIYHFTSSEIESSVIESANINTNVVLITVNVFGWTLNVIRNSFDNQAVFILKE
jgi:hypothetical protein